MSNSNSKSSRPVSRRTILRTAGLGLGLQAVMPRPMPLWAAQTPGQSPCLAFTHTTYPPLLERFIQKLNPADDDFPTEQYAEEIGSVLDAWSKALCQSVHAADFIKNEVLEEIISSSLQPSLTTPLRTAGPLRIERRVFGGPETKGHPAFLKTWSGYFATFASLEVAELEIYGIRLLGESPLRVETELRCDLVGINKDGGREQRVGSWIISWIQQQQKWFAQRFILNPEVRSHLSGPGFTDVTTLHFDMTAPGMRQLGQGIDEWRTQLDAASGIDVYGNHGIAVGDIDESGFDSIYVCQPSGLPNRLYRNKRNGTFEDITEISGTGILDGTASALFVDFLNRGQQDLLVVRSGGPLLFTNQGNGRFEAKPDAFQFNRPAQGTFTSAAVADYDRDGFLDIYFCVYSYYQGLNQYAFPSPYYDAQNGPPNFLFRNRGDGTFEDVTASSGMDQNNNRYSFAAAWCDYDNNGWPDLYVANDFGRKNLYRSTGDRHFTDVAHEAGVEDYGPGMSVCWLDQNNNGLQDLYVANMWLMEGKRITANENFLPGAPAAIRALYRKHNAGNSLYQNDGHGAFNDKTSEAGSAMARWSWSCAAWDFDHDGFDDLYVANGFVSGPNHHDLQSFFWRQVARRSLAPTGASSEYEMAWNAVNELIRSDYSWSGHERNVFYANNHDGTFSDISGVLGLDFRDDSRAYALSDFDHDGRLELVLKNRTGPQLRLLRNNLRSLGSSVAFHLTGHTSNRDAIGASITIEAGATRQTKIVSAGSGFASQHTKDLHFGVGDSSGPLSISIRWPNGTVQKHANIPLNSRVEIDEGAAAFKATRFTSNNTPNAAPITVPPPSPTVSTWLISPVFGPNNTLPDLQSGPALLSFTRPDCGVSKQQFEQLQKAAEAFASAGLPVFQMTMTDEKALGAWNIFCRYLFDRRRDIVFPISFLLDKSGAIIHIYQGVTDSSVILDDWKSAPNTPAERLTRALPFPGPYFGPPMSHNYFTDGVAYIEYGYVDEARNSFQRVVDADPAHAGAWFNLGTIYLGKKMYVESRKCLSESVRLNPQDSDAWNNLGMISGESGNYDQALIEFQKAALANPNHLLAVQNMMRIFQFQGRAADAQKMLEELIAKAPENPGLHLAYGMALVAQDQTVAALAELETAVRLGPGNPDALNDLGALLVRMGRSQEALKWFDQCRLIAPDFDRPVLNTAAIYSKAGQPSKARQLLQEFSARHPDNADIRNALDKLGTN